MLKINKINQKTCRVYESNGNLLGVANELELLDLRIRIAEQKLDGYFCLYDTETEKDLRVNIGKFGETIGNNIPFIEAAELTMKLYQIQRQNQIDMIQNPAW